MDNGIRREECASGCEVDRKIVYPERDTGLDLFFDDIQNDRS